MSKKYINKKTFKESSIENNEKIILAQPTINLKESSKYINKVLKNNFPNEGEQTKLFEKNLQFFKS